MDGIKLRKEKAWHKIMAAARLQGALAVTWHGDRMAGAPGALLWRALVKQTTRGAFNISAAGSLRRGAGAASRALPLRAAPATAAPVARNALRRVRTEEAK